MFVVLHQGADGVRGLKGSKGEKVRSAHVQKILMTEATYDMLATDWLRSVEMHLLYIEFWTLLAVK